MDHFLYRDGELFAEDVPPPLVARAPYYNPSRSALRYVQRTPFYRAPVQYCRLYVDPFGTDGNNQQ